MTPSDPNLVTIDIELPRSRSALSHVFRKVVLAQMGKSPRSGLESRGNWSATNKFLSREPHLERDIAGAGVFPRSIAQLQSHDFLCGFAIRFIATSVLTKPRVMSAMRSSVRTAAAALISS
jgi:hypothetical protein